jgi:hypothetical protein
MCGHEFNDRRVGPGPSPDLHHSPGMKTVDIEVLSVWKKPTPVSGSLQI